MKLNTLTALALGALWTCSTASAVPVEDGFKALCNGRDLTGWDGNPELWSVKNGAIVGKTTPEHPITVNTFLIWTNGTTSDFELRCSFRITANNDKNFANSGMQYRSKVLDPKLWIVGGYQADMEAGPNYTGILYDERGVAGGRGIMAARGEKVTWGGADCKKQVTGSLGTSEEIGAAIKKADWNEYVVIVKGNHFQHFINGKATIDLTDECESKLVKSGVLALQLHVGGAMTVEFKDLRIKDLSGGSAANGDIPQMAGDWEIASSEVNGEAAPAQDAAGLVLKITGANYSVVKGDFNDHGTFSTNPGNSPKTMDIHPESGRGAGRMIPAIYEFDGDTLRVCYATEEGSDRPKAFKTKPDSGEALITYKRKK